MERRTQSQHLTTGIAQDHLAHMTRTPSPLAQIDSGPSTSPTSTRRTLAQRYAAHGHATTLSGARLPLPGAIETQETSGATPNFELSSDTLFAGAEQQGAQDALGDFGASRSRSVPPLALDSGATLSDRRHKTARRKLPPINTVHRAGSKRRNYFGETEKRPASPHITSATPTSARHHYTFHERLASAGPIQRIASPHDDVGGESFTIDQTIMSRSSSTRSPPLRQTSLGRVAANAAHSLMDAVTGRISPTTYHARSARKPDREGLSDDEAGKGHGKKSVGRFTPTVLRGRNEAFGAYPREKAQGVSFQNVDRHTGVVAEPEEIAEGFSGNIAWRASISESRRATPAAYRPRPGTPRKRGSGGQHIDPDESTEVILPSSRSTTHSIHIGSPIVIPQARRGAIRLRPRRHRRSSRLSRPRLTFKQRCYVLLATISSFVRLLANPAEAGHRLREWLVDTRIYWDDAFRDPVTGARCWRPPWLRAYVPLLIWLAISLSSTALVITFHTEVFTALDRMAVYLQQLGLRGRLLLGSLIFITTFPPLPLYSTLIILCGFTFGLWQGFIISYVSALLGAIVVFLLSRSLLKDWMVGLLNQSGGLKKVVRAIEKQPKLLFLVRLAPYPYNLMNTLLASSQTLTLKTYITCTGLALPKLLVHTGVGTSIKDFAAYNGVKGEGATDEDAAASHSAETVKHVFGLVGVGLCFGIFIYLLQVARKAVDELDDDTDGVVTSCVGESDDLLSDDSLDEGSERDDVEDETDARGGLVNDSEGVGMDMRERFGPGSHGFRNGYAPVSPDEGRLREQIRHSVVPMDRSALSLEEVGSGGGGGSIDLAEKIAEMEAHAEGMGLGGPSTLGAGGDGLHGRLPDWLYDCESPIRGEFGQEADASAAGAR
ncbi:hypothetical protein ACQY0O_003366 [Thecaphora frezii]